MLTSTRRILRNSIKNLRSVTTTATASSATKQVTSSSSSSSSQKWALVTTTTGLSLLTLYSLHNHVSSSSSQLSNQSQKTSAYKSLFPESTTSCEVVMIGPIKEPSTGILFPQLCNGMQFVGCGVRVKYGFVKV